MSFSKGDVVRMKSGGPRMTVAAIGISRINNEPYVECVWFETHENKHVPSSAKFSPSILEKCTNPLLDSTLPSD